MCFVSLLLIGVVETVIIATFDFGFTLSTSNVDHLVEEELEYIYAE